MTTHVVFGAGLIGCYLGSVIAHNKPGTDSVTLVARPGVIQCLANGTTLTDYQGNRCHVEPFEIVPEIEGRQSRKPIDYLWLTVKCTDIEQAINDFRSSITDSTVILCCQNGIGVADIVQHRLPNYTVLSVMVPFNVVKQGDAHFHRGSEGQLVIEQSRHDEYLLRLLNTSATAINPRNRLLSATTYADMQAMQWAKLQLNLGNSINALANIPVKAMLEQRGYRLVIAAMMQELLKVVSGLRLRLPKIAGVKPQWLPWVLKLPNGLFLIVANKMLAIDPSVRTSMWWDLQHGRQTEIDFLNGAVIVAARKMGIDCPVNRAVISLIKQLEQVQQHTRKGLTADELCMRTGVRIS